MLHTMFPVTKLVYSACILSVVPLLGSGLGWDDEQFPGENQQEEHIFDQRMRVIDALWPKVAKGARLVGSYELDVFFSRYDPENSAILDLFEPEFLNDPVSWINDFSSIGVTDEFAKAYFRALDVYLENFYPRLTFEDTDDMVGICEIVSGGDGFGIIDRAQFNIGFENVVLRGVPFMLLFVRYNTDDIVSVQNLEQLDEEEFKSIFFALDANDDSVVTEEEMENFWQSGLYGPRFHGTELFRRLDLNTDGLLVMIEWLWVFDDLDCRDWDKRLDTEELWQLDLILHDERSVGGMCTLRREYYRFLHFLWEIAGIVG